MTRDISDLLADAVEDRAHALGDLRPSPARFAHMRVRIRRRRIVRRSLEVGAGVAASGVVATGVWFGLLHGERAPAPPVGTTSPAPSPSSLPTTPAATPPPTTSPTAPARSPVEAPGLPSALPAPAGLLDRTGPGWLLTVYRSLPAAGPGTAPATANAVIAVSPDGTRYLLADLPPDQALRIVDWRAGADRARALLGASDQGTGGATAGWLDLRTGAFQKDDPAGAIPSSGALSFLARLANGTELWQQDDPSGGLARLYAVATGGSARPVGDLSDGGAAALVNPSGTLVATEPTSADRLVVLRVADGVRTEVAIGATNGECHALGWIDDASLLVQCFDHTGGGPVVSWNPRLVRVDAVAGTVVQLQALGVGQPFASVFQHGANVGPGAVAFPAYTLDGAVPVADVCANGLWEWSAGGVRQLWAMDGSSTATMSVAAAGEYVFFDARPGCQSGSGAPEVVGLGPDGTARVVAPAPPDSAAWSTELSWTPAR